MKKWILIFLTLASLQVNAQEVIYHVFQRSFFDSNDDGHGDLNGMRQKLDYLQELGVTSILLTPLYQSEFYHNYFATDFEQIDREYGTLDDYLSLVKEIHKRKMKIYQDVEMQYVTHEHPWYGSVGNLSSPFSNYIYYLDAAHTKPFFFYHIPEFTTYNNLKQKIAVVNMNDPEVWRYTLDVLKFWVDPNHDGKFDDGVDGFRLDHMMDDLDNFKILSDLFRNFWSPILTDLKQQNSALIIAAEQANWFSLGHEYFDKAKIDRVFGFRLWWASETFNKKSIQEAADSTLLYNPEGKQQIIFIENHDTRRYASVKGMTLPKMKVGAALNLLIGGVPLIYYGQELGMTGVQMKGKTDGNDIPIREAFEWTASATDKGMALWYKNTGPWWDSTQVKPFDGISYEEEKKDPNSLWSYYRKLIQIRKFSAALSSGNYREQKSSDDQVFSFLRYTENDYVLVLINLCDQRRLANVDLSYSFRIANEMMSEERLPIKENSVVVSLLPFEVKIFQLKK